MDKEEEKLVCRWEYDNYNPCIENAVNKVELFDTWMGQKIVVTEDNKIGMEIHADRDLWGTFISFSIGGQTITIAQEDETKSFMDAFIGALERFKGICNLGTEPPLVTEFSEKCQICGVVEGGHDPNCHLVSDPHYYDEFSKGNTNVGTSGTGDNASS